ncbi:DUF998 domain-containing protein [Halorarius halobius]|uniref:DUF998 domain-containing protein n=1 Tax=Halorarius halobius TaxID=2962671 RepID=UPI0020CBCF7C|nr:DUF998 domain-containing protein [Halorarius halobius]
MEPQSHSDDVVASTATPTDLLFGVPARHAAGVLLLFVSAVAILGIITAEALYPGYNVVREISDLGASRPPNSVIVEPAATVFNTTMLLSGAGLLAATAFVHRALGDRSLTVTLGLFGLGVFGVGVFDGSEAPMHGIFALLTFTTGGLAALASARAVETPFRYVAAAFGAVSLTMLVSVILLGDAHPLIAIGLGGIERWVVYPLLVWTAGFGGVLLGEGGIDG